jgi:hypothetical protein
VKRPKGGKGGRAERAEEAEEAEGRKEGEIINSFSASLHGK